MPVRRQVAIWSSILFALFLIVVNGLQEISAIASHSDISTIEAEKTVEEIPIEREIVEAEKTVEEIPIEREIVEAENIVEETPIEREIAIEPLRPTLLIKSYSVQENDSLWKIADAHNLDVFTLQSLNKLKDAHVLHKGLELKIPNQRGILHTVRKNETLEDLAIRYQADLQKIIVANAITESNLIYVGTHIFIPDAKITTRLSKKLLSPRGFAGRSKPRFIMPAKGRRTDGFGYRMHPILRRRRLHKGIDISGAYGSPVRASADGQVSFSGRMGGYGRLVVIDHRKGFETRYAHNSRLKVKKGQKVKQGEIIALIGNSGRVTGTHLHFELRKNGVAINPDKYVKKSQ